MVGCAGVEDFAGRYANDAKGVIGFWVVVYSTM